jgi:hypothetical protein
MIKKRSVDEICEHDHSEGNDKNDGVINGVFQHFNNMRPRPTKHHGDRVLTLNSSLADQFAQKHFRQTLGIKTN